MNIVYFSNNKADMPFLTSEFIHFWLERVGKTNSLFKEDPFLLIKKNSLGLQIWESCGRGLVDYFDLSDLSEPSLHSFLQNQSENEWDLTILYNVVLPLSTEQFIHTITNKCDILARQFFVDISPFLKIEQTWDGFYTSTKSGKFRYNLRRAERKLDEIGGLEVVHYVTPDEVKQNIDTAFEIYKQRWEGKYTSSKFSKPEWRDFYKDVAVAFAEKGWMDLVFLKVGDKPIAFCYGFIFNNKYYFYITAIEPNPVYEKYSPGMVLIKHLLEESFKKGLEEFDFMLGDEAYKKVWTKDYREVYTYIIGRNTLKSKLVFYLYTSGFLLKQKVRKSKRLRGIVERVLLLLGK